MAGLSSAGARRVIELIITGDSAGAIRAIEAVSGAADTSAATLKKQGEAMQTVGRTALGLTAPLVAVGAVAGKMAMSFQQSMEMIHTQAGATQAEVNRMGKSILSLAGQGITQTPQELADGLFHLESMGLRGAKALDVLKESAQGAMVGNNNLVDTVTALGSAVRIGIRGTGDFSHAMATMNAIVGSGDMHMQDLADAFGTQQLAAMKTYGASLQDAGAALAVFGDANIRGAAAGTKFAQTLRVMAGPSLAAQKVMEGIGLGSTQLADDIRSPGGLLKALEDLKSHLAGLGPSEQGQVLTEMFGGKQASGPELLIKELGLFQSKLQREKAGVSQWGKDVASSQQTAANQLKMAWAQVSSALVRLGDVVLPIAAVGFKVLAAVVTPNLGLFTKLPAPIRDFIGGLVAFTFVGGGVLLMVGKMIKAYTEVKDAITALGIVTKLQTAWNWAFAASEQAVGDSAATAAGQMSLLDAAETGGGAGLLGRLGGLGALGLGGGALGLAGLFAGAGYLGWNSYFNKHDAAARHVRDLIRHGHSRGAHILGTQQVAHVGREAGGFIPHFDLGGDVFGPSVGTDNVPAMLSPGEFVLSAPAAQAIGPAALNQLNTTGQAPQNFTIEPGKTVIQIEARPIAEAVTRYVLRRAARGPSSLVGGSLATGVTGPPYTTTA